MLKCVGCRHLIREAQLDKINPKFPPVVYGCAEERLPYWTSIGGLMRPGKGNQKAADGCKHMDVSECAVCGSKERLLTYGADCFVAICPVHDQAWGKYLTDERSSRLSPHGRLNTKCWVEVFLEFVGEAGRKGGLDGHS